MTKAFIPVLLLSAFLSAPAKAQSSDPWRLICSDETARELVRKRISGVELQMFESDLKFRCPRLDLPSSPVHDSADRAREASHTDWVYDAYYSADGRTILSAGKDDSLGVWDAETGKLIRRIAMPRGTAPGSRSRASYVRSAMFVGDGKTVAATKDGYPVQLFDLATGARIADAPFTVAPDDFPPRIAATKSGVLLLAGAQDQVLAVDVSTMAVRYRLSGHGTHVQPKAVAVSEAADLIATTAKLDDSARARSNTLRRVYLWRLSTGEKVSEIAPERDENTYALAFSRDGSQLAALTGGTVDVYSVKDLRVNRSIAIHPFSGFDVAFTADGKGLITCQSHPMLWDLATGDIVRHFGPFNDLCHSVDVSPDGKFVVSTSMASDVKIWDIATGAFHRRLGIDVKPPR
jgi:WD40 repeat protein